MTKRIRKKTLDSVLGKKYDAMMGRCYRKSDRSYESYGVKNIKVCSSWILDLNAFRSWAKAQLETQKISQEDFCNNAKNYILDRVDSTGHYTPENCRFTDPQTSSRNTSRKRLTIVSAEGHILCV